MTSGPPNSRIRIAFISGLLKSARLRSRVGSIPDGTCARVSIRSLDAIPQLKVVVFGSSRHRGQRLRLALPGACAPIMNRLYREEPWWQGHQQAVGESVEIGLIHLPQLLQP